MIDRDVNDEEDEQKARALWTELQTIRRTLRAKIVDPPYIEGETENIMRRAGGNVVCKVCGHAYRMHPDYMERLGSNGESFLQVLCDGSLVHL